MINRMFFKQKDFEKNNFTKKVNKTQLSINMLMN